MNIKKYIVIFLFLTTSLLAHKVAGVDTSIEKIANNKILIKAFFKKSKKSIFGNEVRLISMFDNRVLNKGKLLSKGLELDIPTESYWVYVLYRDNDIVKEGPAPSNGFKKAVKKDKIAFIYTATISFILIIISVFIAYRKTHNFKQNLS